MRGVIDMGSIGALQDNRRFAEAFDHHGIINLLQHGRVIRTIAQAKGGAPAAVLRHVLLDLLQGHPFAATSRHHVPEATALRQRQLMGRQRRAEVIKPRFLIAPQHHFGGIAPAALTGFSQRQAGKARNVGIADLMKALKAEVGLQRLQRLAQCGVALPGSSASG